MTLWGAGYASAVLALVLCVVLWRRSRSAALLPVVLLLAVPVVVDVPMRLLERHLLEAATPFAGLDRALYHAHTALLLAWPAALAASSWRVFASQKLAAPGSLCPARGRPSGAAGPSRKAPGALEVLRMLRGMNAFVKALASLCLVVACLAVAYPLPPGWTLPLERAVHVVAVLGGAAAVRVAWGRAWGRPHAAVLLLLCVELVSVTVGPWADSPAASWSAAQALYLLAFGVLSVLFGAWLWRDVRGSASGWSASSVRRGPV